VKQIGAAAADLAAIHLAQARQGLDAQFLFRFGAADETPGSTVPHCDLVKQLFGEGSLANAWRANE
jgi:hypothetical protein